MTTPTRPAVHAPSPARALARASALLAGTIAVACTVALTGCAAAPAARPATPSAAPAVPAERPLAGLARGGALVFPVQHLELAAGVAAPSGGAVAALRAMDGELAFALDERGLGTTVAGPAVAERLARSNPTYAADPRALPLSAARPMKAGDDVDEPLSSQLRAVAALADRRHVVVPLALRVEPVGTAGGGAAAADDAARVTLRVALVDVRMARVLWTGSTEPVEGPYPSGALAPRVAARFADLFAAPPEP
ncbi:MAG TPA: hypothetical protein VFX39_03870 [Gemmatimonadaceae bacterium]|nr:hypothetical protein [Gemmatimonadaceae bacterium]